jgi:two-component system, NtrC family, nitrogen regulation sensor histidine kinase NtrY
VKVILGFRFSVIVLFLILYVSSMFIIQNFYAKQLEEINSAFVNIKFSEALSELSFQNEEDENSARELMNRFSESLVSVEAIEREARIYSALYLFILMLLSIGAFIIIFSVITKPLEELRKATEKIQHGDFSVQLQESGFREMRELIHSFNTMSAELQAIQAKLLEAEKQAIWKEFSRILAHEIKNPLTPIQLSVERLEEKYFSDEKRFMEIFPESIKIINQEIQNLYNLAKTFSNFAKDIEPEKVSFNPFSTIQDIITPYQTKFNIQLSGSKNMQIRFDPMNFYQIITNILQNAMDASEEENPIRIIISEKKETVAVEIQDEGCGIEKEDIPKIFEPYFSKKKKGIGLGMALVKKLVDINGAKIFVESEVNKGTKFILEMENI